MKHRQRLMQVWYEPMIDADHACEAAGLGRICAHAIESEFEHCRDLLHRRTCAIRADHEAQVWNLFFRNLDLVATNGEPGRDELIEDLADLCKMLLEGAVSGYDDIVGIRDSIARWESP